MFTSADLYGNGVTSLSKTNPEPAEVEAYAQTDAVQVTNITAKDKFNVYGTILLLIIIAVLLHSF
jgi:hypothetical protein